MRKEDFDKIMSQLDSLIKQCEECQISSSAEFNALTVIQLRERIEKAKTAKSNMDKVLNTELYHIIGMGNLTVVQEVQFCKKIREYGSHRPYIQAICTYALPTTPTIPAKTDYNCRTLKVNLNKEL